MWKNENANSIATGTMTPKVRSAPSGEIRNAARRRESDTRAAGPGLRALDLLPGLDDLIVRGPVALRLVRPSLVERERVLEVVVDVVERVQRRVGRGEHRDRR